MPTHWEANSEPIAGYRLIERLGRGGFGEVWKAEAPGGLTKAIKFVFGTIQADNGNDRNHADQELKALARVRGVRHPFILSMERFDIVNGQLVIVMELADRNLDDRLRECHAQGLPGLPRGEVLKYLSEAAEALDLMNNEHDLQHLDIKPANLFLVGSHVKVADFGLVKDLEGRTAEVTGGVTPVYAAPETFDGWVSRNTDQYSLAIVYQELLSGQRPFGGPSARQFMMQHLTAVPDLDSLPECDRPIIAKALAKDPDQRHGSCTALVEALAGAAQGTGGASVPVTLQKSLGLTLASPTPVIAQEEFETQISRSIEGAGAGAGAHASGPNGRFGKFPGAAAESIESASDGTLRPTLVIGVGRTGARALERLERKFKSRYGDRDNWPPIRFLLLDSDANVLKELEKTEPVRKESHDRFLACKVRKPTQYFQKWEELKHLSSWLDPNYLFQITALGTTNGFRPLGRLALVDNYRRVEARIRAELEALMAPERLEAACGATGGRLWRSDPRAVIIANMAGGTGSGMFVDLCYLTRRLLLERGASVPDTQGMLVASKASIGRDEDLRRANQYALAQDLLNWTQPNVEFAADYDGQGEAERFTGPPVETATLFDASAETVPDPKDEVILDEVAELVFHGVADAMGRHWANETKDWPRFRTAGWFSLLYPRRALLKQVACRLCRRMVEEWIQAVPSKRRDEMIKAAENSLGSAGFDPAVIANHVLDECNKRLEQPLHVLVGQRIAQFEEELLRTEYAKHPEARDRAIDDLKQILGLDPNEEEADIANPPLLDQVIVGVTNTVAGTLLAPLAKALAQILDEPGNRVERARRTIEGFAQYLIRMVDQQQELARTAQQAVMRRARELRGDRAPMGQTAAAMLRGEGGGVVGAIRRYAKEKIDCRMREQVAQVFLVLRGKLSDKSRELVVVRQTLDHLANLLKEQANEPPEVGGHSAQTLFPNGLLQLGEAVEQVARPLEEDRIGALELRVQQSAIVPLGGLHAACTAGDDLAGSLAGAMVAQAMSWVQEMLPPGDVVDAFYDRHREDSAGMANELKAFIDWAQPSMEGKMPKGSPAGAAETPTIESFFLSVPDSPAGAHFAGLVERVSGGAKPNLIVGSDSCNFCRTRSNASLARLLPPWLLESRRLYDQACQGRLTPEVFPQLAKR